jgi:hypothetical protein
MRQSQWLSAGTKPAHKCPPLTLWRGWGVAPGGAGEKCFKIPILQSNRHTSGHGTSMHSSEPMVALHTRSASEDIPSRDSVYDQSAPYNPLSTRLFWLACGMAILPRHRQNGQRLEERSARDITSHSLRETLTVRRASHCEFLPALRHGYNGIPGGDWPRSVVHAPAARAVPTGLTRQPGLHRRPYPFRPGAGLLHKSTGSSSRPLHPAFS